MRRGPHVRPGERGKARLPRRQKTAVTTTVATASMPQTLKTSSSSALTLKTTSQKEDKWSVETEENIVQFFEERPIFYDQGNDNYKNRQKKNALHVEVAATIGWDAKSLWTRFASNRTDHGKLNNPKNTKSGQAARRLTKMQQFKLERYSFLDAYIRPRTDVDEMGKLPASQTSSITVDDDDDAQDVDDDDDADSVTKQRTSTYRIAPDESKRAGSRPASQETKKRKNKPEVVDLLKQMLGDSRAKEKEVSKKVEEALMKEDSPLDDKSAWGQWLASTTQAVPREYWRQFQRETFQVAMRFLPTEPFGQEPPRTSIQQQPVTIQHQPVSVQQSQSTMQFLQQPTTPSGASWNVQNMQVPTRPVSAPAAQRWDMNLPSTFSLPSTQTSQASLISQAFYTSDSTPGSFHNSLEDSQSDHSLINTTRPRESAKDISQSLIQGDQETGGE